MFDMDGDVIGGMVNLCILIVIGMDFKLKVEVGGGYNSMF